VVECEDQEMLSEKHNYFVFIKLDICAVCSFYD